MYNGEALGRRKSPKRRARERAAVFTAPRQSEPRRGRRLARISAVLVVLVAVGASIPKAYSGLQGSDLFKLQEIIVVGSHYLTADEVVIQSRLSQGTNLFETNLKSATDSIVAHPLVRRALLLRRPPDSLVISVEERVPIALISTNQGLLGFDCDAVSFDLPTVPFDLPVITGLEKVLSDSTLSEFVVLQSVARLIGIATAEQTDFWQQVSEVFLLTQDEGDLILTNGLTLKIRLEGISEQIQNFRVFLASGNVRPADLAYIDLRYENQVVAGRLPADSIRIGIPSASGTLD
jgi:cell division septal protein FtsQ